MLRERAPSQKCRKMSLASLAVLFQLEYMNWQPCEKSRILIENTGAIEKLQEQTRDAIETLLI